jgi:hypothetical protein
MVKNGPLVREKKYKEKKIFLLTTSVRKAADNFCGQPFFYAFLSLAYSSSFYGTTIAEMKEKLLE